MTPGQHITEAENLLGMVAHEWSNPGPIEIKDLLMTISIVQMANAHATLALARQAQDREVR